MSAELATVSTSESLVSLLSRMSLDPAFNRENFAVLVAAAREEREGTRRAEFAAAMHAIQSRNLRVYRSKAGKNNKYAPLEDIHEMLAPLLHENGLTVNFNCEPRVDNGVVFRSIIIQHVNGHSETRTSPFPVDDIGANREGKRLRPAIQDYGSTASYARRYLLKDAFNIVETNEDDDAGDAQIISQKDADSLRVALDQSRHAAFLKWAGVDSFDCIPVKKLDDAWRMINGGKR